MQNVSRRSFIHRHCTDRLTYDSLAVPCITDCVLAELEKLGPKYRIALK